LGVVLDYLQSAPRGERHDGIEVRRLAVQMNRSDRHGPRRDAP
jgi:hypothetical protein